jgi:hypothetical protein
MRITSAELGEQKLELAKEVQARYICSFLLLVLSGCFSPSKPHADEILVENFTNHRDKFVTLVNMVVNDKDLESVTTKYVLPENTTISEQRLQEYRRLLKELDLCSIEVHQEAVFLTAYIGGSFPDDGVYKGYVYFPDGIPGELKASVIDNLDGLEWNANHVTKFYKKIDEKWYLWFLA